MGIRRRWIACVMFGMMTTLMIFVTRDGHWHSATPATDERGGEISDELYHDILHHMPIPTCDVLFLNPARNKTLLFKRRNKPVQGVYYTLGGRLAKNEKLLDCAARKLKGEVGMVASVSDLEMGGVNEEIFEDSAFPGINSHCVNTVFGYVLSDEAAAALREKMDGQHSEYKWFDVADPDLHPLIQKKLSYFAKR